MKTKSKNQNARLAENSTATPSINQALFPRLDCGNDKQELEFTCPRCGGHKIGEYDEDHDQTWVNDEGQVMGGVAVGEPAHAEFICWDCGDRICTDRGEPIRSRDDLVRHLKGEDIDLDDYFAIEFGALPFCCPECGGEQLDEVFTTVSHVYVTEEDWVEYGKDSNHSHHFRCQACRWIVEDQDGPIKGYEPLASWLKANFEQNPDE